MILIETFKYKDGRTHGRFKCEHGKIFECRMVKGKPRNVLCSCEPYKNHHRKHLEAFEKTREYRTWKGLRQRCSNPKNENYIHYGARGITFCERWDSYVNFLEDMGRCPPGLSLDRVDNNKGYL